MTEADLDILLDRSSRRLRVEYAVRRALLAFGICLLAAAGIVLAVRLADASSRIIATVLLALPLSALLVWIIAYWHCRPSLRYVALLLDRRAGTLEHLVTWHELRRLPESALNEMQRGFRAAQRLRTLQHLEGCAAKRLFPVKLPGWTRSLGLALLFLCCALLVPPQTPAQAELAAADTAAGKQFPRWNSEPLGPMAAESAEAPRVQVLSPTENIRYWLELTDPGKSLEEKAQLLKKLESKLGGLPQKALSPELQQACNDILEQLGKKKAADTKTDASSSQSLAAASPEKQGAIPRPEGAANIVEFKEKAFSAIRQQYADVREPLERYYKAVSGQ